MGSGATDAVGDAALAGVGATPAADEPVMRDRLDQETEGMLDPDRVTRTDDAADDLPRGGIPIDVFWQTGVMPADVWIPDQGVTPYRGRG